MPPDPDEDALFEQDHEEGINFEQYDLIPVEVTGNNTNLPRLESCVARVTRFGHLDAVMTSFSGSPKRDYRGRS